MPSRRSFIAGAAALAVAPSLPQKGLAFSDFGAGTLVELHTDQVALFPPLDLSVPEAGIERMIQEIDRLVAALLETGYRDE